MKKLNINKRLKILIFTISILLCIAILIILIMKNKQNYIPKSPFVFEDIELKVYELAYLEEIIKIDNVELIENKKINTEKIGTQEISFIFYYKKEKYKGKINIEIIDDIAPIILANSNYTIEKGKEKDFLNTIICGDNYDDKPTRKIIGEYNKNQEGIYELTYYAKDSSGNEATKDFKVRVVNKKRSNSSNSTKKIYFSDIYKNHKNENTEIGIDVSKWQGNIDFEKVKQSGCEFVIIRLGYQKGINGEMILDPYYKENIKKAKEYDLKVGVYIYTYAKSEDDAIIQAKWVLQNIGPYELELGISYDWESWTLFNSLELSFYKFTNIANTFLNYVEKEGYKGLLYSSKYYLENIWLTTNHKIWLAHYTNKTDYEGKYNIWQMTNSGRISGINGNVDINILYKD